VSCKVITDEGGVDQGRRGKTQGGIIRGSPRGETYGKGRCQFSGIFQKQTSKKGKMVRDGGFTKEKSYFSLTGEAAAEVISFSCK